MTTKSITFIFPGISCVPSGGVKIILQYVNKLSEDGFDITLVYPLSMNFRKVGFISKTKSIIRWFRYRKKYSVKNWFDLNLNVKETMSLSSNYRHIQKSYIYVCTSVETSYYLNEYPVDKCRKVYFIQDFENWNVSDKEVRDSYHFNMGKIVVSNWLKQILKEENEKCVLVKNSFDFSQYSLKIPIQKKNKYQISMLYNKRVDKDIVTGFKALEIVHRVVPQLKVILFGVEKDSSDIPQWMDYEYNPNLERHNIINNESAIYLGCSKSEGWGLTIGEAMMCGQAVVCTNNKGYQEMAINDFNELVSPVQNPQALADNIIRLIYEDSLRMKIANNGFNSIKAFSIDGSYQTLKNYFLSIG